MMAMVANVSVKGLRRTLRAVKDLEKGVNEEVTSGAERGAQILQREFIRESPVWSGNLKKSWRRIRSKRNAWRVQSTEWKQSVPHFKLSGPRWSGRSYALFPHRGTETTKQSSVGYVNRAIKKSEKKIFRELGKKIDMALKR